MVILLLPHRFTFMWLVAAVGCFLQSRIQMPVSLKVVATETLSYKMNMMDHNQLTNPVSTLNRTRIPVLQGLLSVLLFHIEDLSGQSNFVTSESLPRIAQSSLRAAVNIITSSIGRVLYFSARAGCTSISFQKWNLPIKSAVLLRPRLVSIRHL